MKGFISSLMARPSFALYRRTGFIFAVESAGKLVLFATTFVAASILPAGEFAQFGVLLAMQQFVALLAQGGIAEAVIGEIGAEKDSGGRSTMYRTALVALAWSSLFAAAAVLVWTSLWSPLTGLQGLGTALSLLASGVASAAVMLRANFLVLEGNTRLSCGLKAAFYFCSAGGGLGLLILLRSAEGYFWGTCLLGVPCGYLAWRQSGTDAAASVSRDALVRLFRRSLPFTGTALLGWAAWSGATLAIYACFDARVTACYTLLTSLSSILVFATGAINQAWQPEMVKSLRGTGLGLEQSRKYLADLLEIALLGGAMALLILVVIARERSVWFPARYPEMELLLPIGFAWVLVNLNYYVSVNQFVFCSAGQRLLQISAATYLVGGVVWVALGYWFGEAGVYAGWGLTHFIRGIVVSRHAARQWSVRTHALRTFRVLAILTVFFYFLSLNPQVQAWRGLLH